MAEASALLVTQVGPVKFGVVIANQRNASGAVPASSLVSQDGQLSARWAGMF